MHIIILPKQVLYWFNLGFFTFSIYLMSTDHQSYQSNIKILISWKIQPQESVKKSLSYFLKNHQFKSLAQYNQFSHTLSQFHKQISKSEDNQESICQQFFQLIRQVKKRLKQVQNQGKLKMEKYIKSKITKVTESFKNLIDVDVEYPSQLLSKKNVFQTKMTTTLYRSFITFYPQAHSDVSLNIKAVKFIRQLFDQLQRKYYSYPAKQYFIKQIDKLCVKFQKLKYLSNKKKMLIGQITVQDIIQKKKKSFENIGIKQFQQSNVIKILKQSQIQEQFKNEKSYHYKELRQNQQVNGQNEIKNEKSYHYKELKQNQQVNGQNCLHINTAIVQNDQAKTQAKKTSEHLTIDGL